MRTTIDLDEKLTKRAMELTHTKTRKEVVNLSLNEIIRNRLLQELADMVGNYEIDLTLDDLEELRRDDHIFEIDRGVNLDNLFPKKLS
ncbi:MAG: type II toxin-antitoxin system VapB family antitoxin [Candidatus Desantisbacteria bacterium]